MKHLEMRKQMMSPKNLWVNIFEWKKIVKFLKIVSCPEIMFEEEAGSTDKPQTVAT